MELPTVLLDQTHYTEYISGKEIEIDVSAIQNKNVAQGDHVMVYKDTIASMTDVALPRRDKQSEYIGVEGVVTSLNTTRSTNQNLETLHSLNVKKI